ncbi:hypothetical protein TA5114_02504 [Cognatishimia activa]|uniref:Uncharacterized protein n=1 Tax=Cognatishimia activa TaxID=1715691 RepID=A0A0N7MBY3_9RHOB|nr:hypothetical protein [Cognatishimia activa]CUK26688.1 hypothetical protein TA5114_02504 [Cognatishimia activa]
MSNAATQDQQDALLDLLDQVMQHELDFLTELGPLILCASALGVAKDTRSFARLFEAAHALVIRECTHLDEELGLITVEDRGEKSGRRFFALTAQGAHFTKADPLEMAS